MAKRSLKRNLVIVCEGAKTEPLYLEALKSFAGSFPDRIFEKILIVPVYNREQIIQDNQNDRAMRRLLTDPSSHHYYLLDDKDDATYNRFRAMPLNFVREALLFKCPQNEAYTDAWAVFDKDGHPAIAKAMRYAHLTGVNIAFSSRSIESWFLCHFERNPNAFVQSACDDCKKHEREVQKKKATVHPTCQGRKCLMGYLQHHYMQGYIKAKSGVFHDLKRHMPRALAFASWYEQLETDKPIWNRNPYTDMHRLVMTILSPQALQTLKLTGTHHWLIPGKEYNGLVATDVAIVNKQAPRLVSYTFCDKSLSPLSSPFPLHLHDKLVLTNKPKGATVLHIQEGSEHYYCDINNM